MDESPRRFYRHASIASELLKDLGAGKYPVGGAFPVEAELQERFGVGRHTIRKALNELAEQGVIGRRKRFGTVVLSHRPIQRFQHSLRDVVGLSDFARATTFEISQHGYAINDGKSDILRFENSPRRWARYAGVRYSREDHTPLCWSEVLVPAQLAPSRDDITGSLHPMYELILRQQGFKLSVAEQEIQASPLPATVAKVLEAERESAALVVRRRYKNDVGEVFLIAVNFYPADRYSVRTILTPTDGTRGSPSGSQETLGRPQHGSLMVFTDGVRTGTSSSEYTPDGLAPPN